MTAIELFNFQLFTITFVTNVIPDFEIFNCTRFSIGSWKLWLLRGALEELSTYFVSTVHTAYRIISNNYNNIFFIIIIVVTLASRVGVTASILLLLTQGKALSLLPSKGEAGGG